MTSLILAGVGIAGTAILLRVLSGSLKQMQRHVGKIQSSSVFSSYYKGGFDKTMSRREASLILGNFEVL